MAAELGLLEVERLAALDPAEPGPDGELLDRVLERFELASASSRSFLERVCRLARDVEERHGGAIHIWLREKGRDMLTGLGRDFPGLAAVEDATLERAFVLWLQNVANLPLFLEAPAVNRFAKQLGVSVEELHRTADSLGINAALLDDALELWWEETMTLAGEEEHGPAP